MIKVSILAAAIVALGTVTAASASEGMTPDELVTVTRDVLTDFRAEYPDHAEHFIGFKTWKSGTGAKVKVYATHGDMNMSFDYDCEKHEAHIHCNPAQ